MDHKLVDSSAAHLLIVHIVQHIRESNYVELVRGNEVIRRGVHESAGRYEQGAVQRYASHVCICRREG